MDSILKKFLSSLTREELLLVGKIIDNHKEDTLEYIYRVTKGISKDILYKKLKLIKTEAKINMLPISPRVSCSYIGNESISYLERVGITDNLSLKNFKSLIINSISPSISIFEEHMIYLSTLYPGRNFDLSLFNLYSIERRKIIMKQFREILSYLVEKSKESDSVCIFGIGIMQDIEQMIEDHHNVSKLKVPQEKVINTLANYSVLPLLEDNNFSYFDRLLVPKSKLK